MTQNDPCIWEYESARGGGFRMTCTGGGINCSDEAELYNILSCPVCNKRVEHRGGPQVNEGGRDGR
jgi:hypothetical protein